MRAAGALELPFPAATLVASKAAMDKHRRTGMLRAMAMGVPRTSSDKVAMVDTTQGQATDLVLLSPGLTQAVAAASMAGQHMEHLKQMQVCCFGRWDIIMFPDIFHISAALCRVC